jgi:hypothetical protein
MVPGVNEMNGPDTMVTPMLRRDSPDHGSCNVVGVRDT